MYRRGIVTELAPDRAQARVQFEDRDGVTSWWLDVNMPHASAGKNRVYAMPDIGAQVNCLVDDRGECGTILGAIYSQADAPPATDAKDVSMTLEGGLVLAYDRSAGTLSITVPNGITLIAGDSKFEILPGEIVLTTPSFRGVKG